METVTTSIESTMRSLDLGRTKIYELIASGQLKTVKVGRRRLVRTDSIRALVSEAA